MNRDAESLLHHLRQRRRSCASILGPRCADERQYFRRELVSLFGAAFLWNQPGESVRLESCLSLVEGRPGKSERCRGLTDGMALLSRAPQHLVFDLDQIPRIEECILLKQLVPDIERSRIQRATLSKRLSLRIETGCFGHRRL